MQGEKLVMRVLVYLMANVVLGEIKRYGEEPGAETRASKLVASRPDTHEGILHKVGSQSFIPV